MSLTGPFGNDDEFKNLSLVKLGTNLWVYISRIGTDLFYGFFERGQKTVQAKIIKFCHPFTSES